jgi:acetyl-CoA C-acetyltransferase/acetyl-CoA acyltransferase
MGRIAIVEGIRTPLVKAWTLFENIPAQELGALCVRELLEITHMEPSLVDEVIFGAVAQPAEASNIARVISLYASIPDRKRAYTLSRNCASGLEAITSAAEKIRCGLDEIVIAGGTESMSNIPFLFSKDLTQIFLRMNRAKSIVEKLKYFMRIRPSYLKPVVGLALGLTDPVCGLNMGQTAEILAKEFGITRREQDEFALASHRKTIASRLKLREEIAPVFIPPDYRTVVEDDNGPRENQTFEALCGLKPYFDRNTGTVTVGNSCQVTDGACAVLVMDEERARSWGYAPLGYIRAYYYAGLSPSIMGLGPAYSIPPCLARAGLKLKDIDLIEINEAFAAQVIACIRALASKKFAAENFSLNEAIGEIDVNILNVNGGAIALGHPVGTSGARLVLTLLKEMKRKNLRYGLASMCVGGGQGGAIVLER